MGFKISDGWIRFVASLFVNKIGTAVTLAAMPCACAVLDDLRMTNESSCLGAALVAVKTGEYSPRLPRISLRVV